MGTVEADRIGSESLDQSGNLTLPDKPDKTEPVEGGQRIQVNSLRSSS